MSNNKITPSVSNETNPLRTVVLGLPDSPGANPTLEQTYDAKSYEAVLNNTYPTPADIEREMGGLLAVLQKHNVQVLRPRNIPDCNQIFARDVAFTIDQTLFVSNMIPDRAQEIEAFDVLFDQVNPGQIEHLPAQVRAEGGDVLLYNDILFVGQAPKGEFGHFKTTRTNPQAIDFFREAFPHKTVIPVPLIKHDQDPARSVLHLDCAFQPVGSGKAVLYPQGLADASQHGLFYEIFGRENIFEVTPQEAYYMNTNFVSLSPDTVIIEAGAQRLKNHLEQAWHLTVETVPYAQISKQGGLLRCSTCPIVRAR